MADIPYPNPCPRPHPNRSWSSSVSLSLSLSLSLCLVSRLDFCTTIILLGWQLYKFMPFFPVISLFTFPHIFSRPISFLQKSSCSVSSEKNILNSSVDWSRVEWSDVKKTKSLLSQTCFVYYQCGHTRRT